MWEHCYLTLQRLHCESSFHAHVRDVRNIKGQRVWDAATLGRSPFAIALRSSWRILNLGFPTPTHSTLNCIRNWVTLTCNLQATIYKMNKWNGRGPHLIVVKGLFYCSLVAKSRLEGKGNVENFLTAENCVKVELVTRLVVTSTDKLECGNMWCPSSPWAPELTLFLWIDELTLSPLERSLGKETSKQINVVQISWILAHAMSSWRFQLCQK